MKHGKAPQQSEEQWAEAKILLQILDIFEFSLCLQSMRTIFGITNELSQTLQRKDQDVVNAMKQVSFAKMHLQSMQDSG